MSKPENSSQANRMAEVETVVRKIIADILEMSPARIEADARLIEDLGMDSMKALEILAAIEKRFRIRIPEDSLPKMTTLNRIINIANQYAHS